MKLRTIAAAALAVVAWAAVLAYAGAEIARLNAEVRALENTNAELKRCNSLLHELQLQSINEGRPPEVATFCDGDGRTLLVPVPERQ